jgi:hypothetical protein
MNPAVAVQREKRKAAPELTPTERGVLERKAITATVRAADEQAAAAAREESQGRRRRESEELASAAELAAVEAERLVAAEKEEAAADAARLERSRWFGAFKALVAELSPRFLEQERGNDLAGLSQKAAAALTAALEPAFTAWRAGQAFGEAERLRRVLARVSEEVEARRGAALAARADYDAAAAAPEPDLKGLADVRAAMTAAQAALRGTEQWQSEVARALAAAEATARTDLHARAHVAAEAAHAAAYKALAECRRRCERSVAEILPEAALQRRLTELLLPDRALRGIPELNTTEPQA